MTTIADDLIHRTRAAFPAKANAILLFVYSLSAAQNAPRSLFTGFNSL